MIVKKAKCDNPSCGATETPESEKPYRPPYGWLWIRKATFMGTGPDIDGIEVCSTSCIEAAIDERVKEAEDR